MSEDCLYLNIYTPRDADESSGYAVMLFLHGGSFEFSSGGADVYNGETFVNKGEVILVTTNYRLGKITFADFFSFSLFFSCPAPCFCNDHAQLQSLILSFFFFVLVIVSFLGELTLRRNGHSTKWPFRRYGKRRNGLRRNAVQP